MQLEIKNDKVSETNQIFDKRLKKLFGKRRNNISFSPPINAFNEKNIDDKKNYNHGIFNANTLINKLKENKRFEVISNSFINKLSKNESDYVLKTSNKLSGEEEKYLLKNVFCCLGVISTTKLILEMEEVFNVPIPLKTTPMGYFLIFTSKKRQNNTKFGLSGLSYSANDHHNLISGGVFRNIDFSYYKDLPPAQISKYLTDKIVLQRIFLEMFFFQAPWDPTKLKSSRTVRF